MKTEYIKEWNICYSVFDGIDSKMEYFICLPSFWRVLWWFVRKGRKACEMNIWVSGRLADDEGIDDDIWEV